MVSPELIAITVTSLVEVGQLTFVGWLVYRTRERMIADDTAIFLQGRKVEEILKEMRESLRNA